MRVRAGTLTYNLMDDSNSHLSGASCGPMGPSELTVLVTGGSGFIGSHVVDKLVQAGHTPVIYDIRSPSEPSHRNLRSVRGDLEDLDKLERVMRGCDAVIHLAASAD